MKKITSVIIPARNEQAYIRRTLQSYQQQTTNRPFEVIVVANGCDPLDDTPSIAEDLGARVIELSEANPSMARNKGVKAAEGEILIFNDADTVAAHNYVEIIGKAIDKNYDFGCAVHKPENLHPGALLYSLSLWCSGFIMRHPSGNMYVRRENFERIGGYNEKLRKQEDTDISLRLLTSGARCKFLHSTNVTTSMRRFKESGYARGLFNTTWPYVKEVIIKRRKDLGEEK